MIWDIALAIMAVLAFVTIGIPLIIGALALMLLLTIGLVCFTWDKFFVKKDNVPDNNVGNKEDF